MSSTDTFSPNYRPEPVRRNLQFGPSSELAREIGPDSKKLTVGRDIHLNGEISSCDRLVVEGRVDATLSQGKYIEIAKSGIFKGAADVDEADVNGTFEGKLKVRNRLVIHAAGRVIGEIEYGEVEIERGGEIGGSVKKIGRESGNGAGGLAR
ncbi:MAG: polymer-forming cytoskeletal protein [Alphaproteobacteria bacterium]|nr:polymer-forming cytoskeletal protein [Alphaproteobacteria bacterium]